MKCEFCDKIFDNKKSLSNHRRWHDIPQFKDMQIKFKKQASQFNKGEKNGQWKGQCVGYGALHDYVKHHKPRPDLCGDCREKKKLEIANISQEYKRDLDDWEWLCRRCHMNKDGRLEALHH